MNGADWKDRYRLIVEEAASTTLPVVIDAR
jgi:hypothetical protein